MDKQPKPAGRKRRTAVAAFAVLAVGLGAWVGWKALTKPEEITLDLGNNVKMRLALVPVGKFQMGSPDDEDGRADGEKQYEIGIRRPFYMGVYEVTQEQYQQVMGVNPSFYKGPTNPVECVSWDDAQKFCNKLSARTRRTVTLPTDAQWEYACRAGTTTAFNTGKALRPDQANITPKAGVTHGTWENANAWAARLFHNPPTVNGPAPVGSYPPNAWGLYDMHGNVSEWCVDFEHQVEAERRWPYASTYQFHRGGSFMSDPKDCRSGCRGGYPGYRNGSTGFRIVVLPASEN